MTTARLPLDAPVRDATRALAGTAPGADGGERADPRGAAVRDVLGIDGQTGIEPFGPVVAMDGTGTLWRALFVAAAVATAAAPVALVGPALVVGLEGGGAVLSQMAGAYLLGMAWGALVTPLIAGAEQGASRVPSAAGVTVAGGGVLSIIGSPVAGAAVAGLGAGLLCAYLPAWLVDRYHVAVRVRVLAMHRLALQAGLVLFTGLVGDLAAAGMTQVAMPYGVVIACGVLAVLVGRQLPAMSPPTRDEALLREAVGGAGVSSAPAPGHLAALRRVATVPTARRLAGGYAAAGLVVATAATELVVVQAVRWGLDGWARGVVYGSAALAAVALIGVTGSGFEARYRHQPARLLSAAASGLAAVALALVITGLWGGAGGLAFVLVAVAVAATVHVLLDGLLMTAVRPVLRLHAAALGAAAFGLGGAAGVPLLWLLDSRSGVRTAVIVAALGVAAGAGSVLRARRCLAGDIAAAVGAELEEGELAAATAHGVDLPLLSCRHVDFSYGDVQVLFDVTFTVDDGEMVALLGTNGAGKSTLLRVISGLGFPSGGTLRLAGREITRADPATRVRQGIAQVPGGKAAFGPLSVVDNLRVYGYTLGRDRRAVDAGIEAAFAAFPRLAERRNAPAQVLSGGERQMLALTKALILRPRLLLIDELSLGLAPAVVGELLAMVRQINASGTAVVLVEQSVNVALSLVHHAYYLEKGEVRFDGPAAQLLERPDLLRSVYLEGAAKGMGA